MLLFAGNSNPQLAAAIAKELGVDVGKARVRRFSDGEVDIQIQQSVRGADVYIIQSTCAPVNDNLLELLLMISAMRRASAKRITAVIPYYGYKRDVGAPTHGHEGVARRSRRSSFASACAVPIAAADVAVLLESIGVDRVVSVDLQPPGHGQIEGFFGSKVMVENIETTNRVVEYFRDLLSDSDAPVAVLSPNEACVKRARDVQVGLARALPDGATRVSLAAIVQGGISRGTDRYFHDPSSNVELVGRVRGADVIITDDMVDSGRTLAARVRLLKDNGARRVFAFATHGLLTGFATELLERSALERVVVTDTVPLRGKAASGEATKIVQVSVASTLAEVIRCLHDDRSIKELQHYVPVDEPRYADQE